MFTQLPLERGLLIACLALLAVAAGASRSHAGETPDAAQPADYVVPLSDGDLRAITLEVLATHPLLASSPGVKYAATHREFTQPGLASGAAADVIFHPHAETAGVKNAFRAHCRREAFGEPWSCPFVRLRRYVQLETQDFEVRVTGDLTLEDVLALVEATRDIARSSVIDSSTVPDTVTVIIGIGDGNQYQVVWQDSRMETGVVVEARLRKEGDPTEPADWETAVLPPEE